VKIDDVSASTSFAQNNWANKLQINTGRSNLALEALSENPDLSFLDMLTSLGSDELSSAVSSRTSAPVKKDEKTESKSTTSTAAKPVETPLTATVQETKHRHESDDLDIDGVSHRSNEKFMSLDELSDTDQRYLRQIIIPNVPILMGQVPIQNVFPKGKDGSDFSYRGFELSDGLSDMIKHGYKTGQPIRLELDANSSLVLRIRNGQVSAEFVAADQGTAMAMQNELNDLRQKMAARNLPVGVIESRYKGQPENENNQQNKSSQSEQPS
jgi:hypothetical protein